MPLSKQTKQKIIVLAGPTAIGKTELSLSIAQNFGCEIVSMDSVQIYKYLEIGSAKPTLREREQVPHHLVDYVDPKEEYHVARYVDDAQTVISLLGEKGKVPLLVGGTGLYMKGLLEGLLAIPDIPESVRDDVRCQLREKGHDYLHGKLAQVDPLSAARIHKNDSQRLLRALEIYQATGMCWSEFLAQGKQQASQEKEKWDVIKIGLGCERKILYERINKRTNLMIEQGLLDEVKKLLKMGYSGELKALQTIGYRHMINFIEKKWNWQQTLELLARDTRRYAKRQLTWFGRDAEMNWFRPDEKEKMFHLISQKFTRQHG